MGTFLCLGFGGGGGQDVGYCCTRLPPPPHTHSYAHNHTPFKIKGDHALTGLAIGKMLGIAGDDTVITGPEIDAMTDEVLRTKVGLWFFCVNVCCMSVCVCGREGGGPASPAPRLAR